jgi:phytanoyl-CoA hydroxylase
VTETDVAAFARAYSECGVARVDRAVTLGQVARLKKELYRFIQIGYESSQEIAAFDKEGGSHDRNPLFLDSGSSATVFHEPVAMQSTERGSLEQYTGAVARVGHGLHVIAGEVRDWLLSSDIGDLSRATGRARPAVIESMYVRKSPWSEPLPPHIDHTYLWTDPPSVQVFWLALDRAGAGNGGLMVDVGGRLPGSPIRLVRTADEASLVDVPEYPRSALFDARLTDLRIVDCRPGDGVFVDGLVMHGSDACGNGRPRDALAIHVIDMSCRWSDRNYLGQAVPLEL